MTERRPIVNIAGEDQELPAGDTLPGLGSPQIGATFTTTSIVGSVVYADGAGTVDLAQADATGTSIPVGLSVAAYSPGAGFYQPSGIFTATTGQWDALTGETGGLVAGSKYYLSEATAGFIDLQANLTLTSGDYDVLLGVAISTTELQIRIERRLLKASSS